jgi:hypothetical protein
MPAVDVVVLYSQRPPMMQRRLPSHQTSAMITPKLWSSFSQLRKLLSEGNADSKDLTSDSMKSGSCCLAALALVLCGVVVASSMTLEVCWVECFDAETLKVECGMSWLERQLRTVVYGSMTMYMGPWSITWCTVAMFVGSR